MTLMDMHQLNVFAAVFRLRSFSRASEELHLSQPTVSEHVRRLEEDLDARLFDRVGRKVIPTREGELLYSRAVEIMEKFKGLREDLGAYKGEVKGELSIGASTIPGAHIIPAVAAEFREKYPEVFFNVAIEDSKKITDMVLEGRFLLGIVGAVMGRGQLEYTPVFEDTLVLAAHPSLVGKKKDISLDELYGLPLIMREEGSGTRKSMEQHLHAAGIALNNLNVAAVFGSTSAIKEAVKAGLGASVLSVHALGDDLRGGRIREVGIKGLRMKRSFYAVRHRRRSLPRQYLAFLEWLQRGSQGGK